MKNDLRVRVTLQIIQKFFFELLKEKPLNKITVTAICEAASINRTTFYKYYSDPSDVLSKIENEMIENMRVFFKNSDNTNILNTLRVILNNIIANKEIYSTIISKNGDLNFINKMIMDSYIVKSESMEDLLPNMNQIEKEWLYRFMTYGCTNIIVSWIENDMAQPAEEVAEFINHLNEIILSGFSKVK